MEQTLIELFTYAYHTVLGGSALAFLFVAGASVKIITAPLDAIVLVQGNRLREIQPKLKAIQEKIKNPREQADALGAMYREANVKPALFFLSFIVQIGIILVFWGAFGKFLRLEQGTFSVLGYDLSKPIPLLVIPFLVIFAFQMLQQKNQMGKSALPLMVGLSAVSFFVLSNLQAAFVIYLLVFSAITLGENALLNRITKKAISQ